MSLYRRGGEARTRDKRTFALSALKSDLCIHPERVRQRNHQKSLLWSWPMGCKRERSPPRSPGRKMHVMPVIFWVSTQTLMPICRAEKARCTSSPVRPFTSLDAASVCALESQSHDLQQHFHLMLLACYYRHSWIVFTNSVLGLVVRECRADEHDVVELKMERTVELVHHKSRFA